MDSRIQQSVVASLSARPAATEIGPFVLGLDPGTDSPHANYATPRPGAAVTGADVTRMVAAFRDAGRRPRLEYVTTCAPELEALLTAAGFEVEARHEYLVCSARTLTTPDVPDGFELRQPVSDEDVAALISAQNEAFGGEPVASPADVDRLRRRQAEGGVAVLAVSAGDVAPGPDGQGRGACVGGGQAVPPRDAVSEVTGIAVRRPYRRRGLAGAITAAVTARLFAADVGVAWLEASGEESWRVYERVGYRPAGRRLYLRLP
ncbi:GNAT family N-acetyltransferase [Actinoplanes sp. NPDC049265]|uniref:GNAT family N-acetyltransferase n=1 Tax=Actinoplanes sp. NPDC049265 TaxID=3363902 RepID=UPI0037163A7E